jgi:glyoxylase-like metal-dependent hydrolase (beta-lactamase superfamily II)
MPDFGTGRCDFPGGCAKTLFRSVKEKLYTLPDSAILYSGHDYLPGGRPLRWEAMVGEQKRSNVHIRAETKEEDFVKFRTSRDATLSAPRLYYPSLQVNIAAGKLPKPEKNGISYLRLPVNVFKQKKD